MRTRDVAWIAAIAVMLAGAVALQMAVHASRAVDTVAAAPLGTAAREGDIVLGRVDAPVPVLVLSSLTCPHCARWEAEQLPAVERTLLEVATPFLEDLYERTHETVHLGLREGAEARRKDQQDRDGETCAERAHGKIFPFNLTPQSTPRRLNIA